MLFYLLPLCLQLLCGASATFLYGIVVILLRRQYIRKQTEDGLQYLHDVAHIELGDAAFEGATAAFTAGDYQRALACYTDAWICFNRAGAMEKALKASELTKQCVEALNSASPSEQ